MVSTFGAFGLGLVSTTFLTTTVAIAEDAVVLDGITITSTRTDTAAIDALSGTSVVNRDSVELFQPDTVGELFKSVPGVDTQSDGNDPATAINIRGLQDFGRVNVMIEGARQNFQRSGHGADGVFYLDPELIKKIDVTRGPVSTIFGSGAIGGVVNFGLIDADDVLNDDETLGGRKKLSFDTNDTGILSSTLLAFRPNGSFDAVGNFIARRDDDYSDGDGRTLVDTGEQLVNGFLKARFRPAEGHQITGIFKRQNNSYITSDTDFATAPKRSTDTTITSVIGKYDFDSKSTDLINLKSSFYFNQTGTEQVRLEASRTVPVGNTRTFDVRTFGFDVFNTAEFDTGALEQKLTFGLDGFVDQVKTADPLGTGDEFTPSGRRTVFGGFLQNQINYSTWLQVIGAVRFDRFDLNGGGADLTGNAVSPKVTVGITPVKGVQFFGTYAQGFRAPSVTEVFNNGTHDPAFPFQFLPNLNLKPETAKNFEFGTNLKFDGVFSDKDKFRAKATYFRNKVDNYIEGDVRNLNPFTCFALPRIPQFPAFGPPIPFFLPPSGCGEFQYINIAKAKITGVEVEANYQFDRYFASLAYSRIRGEDEVLNQPLETIRPDTISFTAGARLLDDKLTLAGRLTHVAQQDRIPTLASNGTPNTLAGLRGDAHTLVDLFATYEPNDRVKLGLALNNITNQKYTRYLDVNASEGFSASFTASFKLGR